MMYLILEKGINKLIIRADKIEAVYSEYIMYDRDRTHILVGGKTIICNESVDEVWELMKDLLENAAKEGKPSV